MNEKIITRFAPSPTGYMHVGSVRTALYAWLLAKQQNGQFLLRIEDTDKAREVEGSIEHIQETLDWLGLVWNGDIIKQSDRLDIYKSYAQKLIDKGLAYADPYSPEEVQAFRQQAKIDKKAFLYRNHQPENPPRWDGSQPLRFKVPQVKSYSWQDEVRGRLSAGEEALDDFILIKSDGYPTYNFAHIIDDYEMGISHIFRADEFIASTPRFLSLYEALEINPPKFVTLPPILGHGGTKKLSKRDGAKDILEYRAEGYLRSALINFLASLGWNDGTTQEIFETEELIEKFDIKRIQKSGARFDPERLVWMNGCHIRKQTPEALFELIDQSYWGEMAQDFDREYKIKILEIIQERLKYFSEIPQLTGFFFENPNPDKTILLEKIEQTRAQHLLDNCLDKLNGAEFFTNNIQNILNRLLEENQSKPGELFNLLRIALTNSKQTPPIAKTISVLGEKRTTERIKFALNQIS